jgi:hypothetical protein
MQIKDNAPCNNQPKEPKERKTKKGNLPPRKLSPKKCLQKNKKQKKSPSPLKPIHSQEIGWERGAHVAARKEGAPVDWGLGGRGGNQHEDEVGCSNMPSGVGRRP